MFQEQPPFWEKTGVFKALFSLSPKAAHLSEPAKGLCIPARIFKAGNKSVCLNAVAVAMVNFALPCDTRGLCWGSPSFRQGCWLLASRAVPKSVFFCRLVFDELRSDLKADSLEDHEKPR